MTPTSRPLNSNVRAQVPYLPKIVLNCHSGYRTELDDLIEQFITDRVKLVAVAGPDCSLIENIIDELIVGDGSDDSRFILTSSHPGESLIDVIEFARALERPSGEPQVVEL